MKNSLLILYFSVILSVCASAQDRYVLVFLNSNPDKETLSEEEAGALQAQHMENIGTLAKEGKLLVAGPLEGGGGIFILNTPELDEAKSWILTDPAVRANRWRVELFPMKVRKGIPCLASQEASMLQKQFVRYVPHITKFNVQRAPQLFLAHDDYLKIISKNASVLMEGIFDNDDGGIIIFDTPVEEDLIMEDPTVIEGMIIPEIKTIWIADGSFCTNK